MLRNVEAQLRQGHAREQAVLAGLWWGGLAGVLAAGVFLLATSGVFAVVLVALIPTAVLQLACLAAALPWLAARRVRVVLLIVGTHAAGVAGCSLLWASTEYGAAWPGVARFLALLQAPVALLQIASVCRRLRRTGAAKVDAAGS